MSFIKLVGLNFWLAVKTARTYCKFFLFTQYLFVHIISHAGGLGVTNQVTELCRQHLCAIPFTGKLPALWISSFQKQYIHTIRLTMQQIYPWICNWRNQNKQHRIPCVVSSTCGGKCVCGGEISAQWHFVWMHSIKVDWFHSRKLACSKQIIYEYFLGTQNNKKGHHETPNKTLLTLSTVYCQW